MSSQMVPTISEALLSSTQGSAKKQNKGRISQSHSFLLDFIALINSQNQIPLYNAQRVFLTYLTIYGHYNKIVFHDLEDISCQL